MNLYTFRLNDDVGIVIAKDKEQAKDLVVKDIHCDYNQRDNISLSEVADCTIPQVLDYYL